MSADITSPDKYGRTILFSTDGVTDTYAVVDVDGVTVCFTLSEDAGTPDFQILANINAQAP